ncbi:hypothetical protein HF086_003302 [Spodoptera exigua]|uniref:Uncharacterized protein n=1 Tax=Spodoptera exigua TaxID=7107 RepID=A0A922SNH1_SPOEX|nr:hypothetical protein HF086_003302 [Spodoptera exigua]
MERLLQAPVPGSFFWKPRVALDLASPKGESVPVCFINFHSFISTPCFTDFNKPKSKGAVKAPTAKSIREGYAVGIAGFRVAMAATALASYMGYMDNVFPQLHPCRAHYWTNAYRWAIRYLSLLPDWFSGDTKYVATHRVWRKRFSYMEAFIPKWLRPILYCVSDESWKLEEKEWAKFVKYAEPHFGKYYRYPSKTFNNFNSFRIDDNIKESELSDASIE